MSKCRGYKKCRLSTVYDYCKEHDGIIRVYDDSCEYPARSLCRTREEFEANIFAEPVMRPSYYIYTSRIEDAVIFGNEDFIIAKDLCLTDGKNNIQGSQHYISKNIPEIKAEHALVRMPKSPVVIERGIDLVKMWSNNYYHFSLEALARLQLIDAMEEYRTWPLIVDEWAMRNVWNVQLLEMVNVYHHPVISVRHNKAYLVHELVYPSALNWSEDRASGYAPRMHTMAAEYIRERVMSRYKPSREYRNVYMARGDNKRLLNEEEVVKCLEHYGFESIYPRVDNYHQILDAFMTADNIVGVIGTNIVSQVLSKPEANIYIISPFEFQHDTPGFSVTDASRRALHFIPAEVHKLGSVLYQTNFTVGLEKIESLAQSLSR